MATSDINAIKEETGVYVVIPNNNGSNNYNIAQIIKKNFDIIVKKNLQLL